MLHWQDAEYLSRLEAKRQEILLDTNKRKISTSEDVFLPLPSAVETPTNLQTTQTKIKVKMRGELIHEGASEPDPAGLAADLEQSHISIGLRKHSYATLRAMCPESVEECRKSVDWNSFVESMVDAGFTASTSGGSIVTFENAQGKIVFHRPHPEPSTDPIMLQSMGNRMNKWFGWGRETFTLVKQ